VDLDADGNDEIISGSYWPGHVFVFQGLGEGKFAKGRKLEDSSGKRLIASKPWKNEREPDVDSLAAAPWMVDWDADGHLDLLVGNIAGRVILIRNVGTATEAKFETGRTALQAGGRAIQVPGGDAGPHTADWDGDGKWDLLVGGYSSVQKSAPELTGEQAKTRDRLRKRRNELSREYSQLWQKWKDDPAERDKRVQPVIEKIQAVAKQLRPLEPARGSAGGVWFYRRRADL